MDRQQVEVHPYWNTPDKVFGLVCFYDILTIVGYLVPNPFLYK